MTKFAWISLGEFIVTFIPAKFVPARSLNAVDGKRRCAFCENDHQVGVILELGEDLAVDPRLTAGGVRRDHVDRLMMHIVVVGEFVRDAVDLSAMQPCLNTYPRRSVRPIARSSRGTIYNAG